MKSSRLGLTVVVALAASALGCPSKLASPFDQMKSAPITVLRLQNYEPPQAATPTSTVAPVALPPVLQQWITAGAQMLPPGLLPPGLVPGSQPVAAPSTVPRYHGFPILGSAQVTTQKTQEEILDILGHESNFVPAQANCMYAEFGIAIQSPSAPPAELLVSLSCGQVQAFNMAWPYAKNGLSPDTAKRIVAVMQKSFGG